MQHLENMDHLRQGIHWISVGQRDPLVEYRRQSKVMFEDMQQVLRHDVVKSLFHARPISADELDRPIETELTRAARASVDNADRIVEVEEFNEDDFQITKQSTADTQASKKQNVIKKKRKAERKNRKQSRRKK
jgi:preprotein translocase subunit SecA